MNGNVDYSFEEFLSDLFGEVKSSISKNNFNSKSKEGKNSSYKKTVNEVFRFVSELCFKAAINSPDLTVLLEKSGSEDKRIIEETLISNMGNIRMLRALFMKQIASQLESGLTKRQAAKQVISHNNGILIDFLGKSAREFPI